MAKCLIVPCKAPGKTVHLKYSHGDNGTRIHLWDRLPKGHPEYLNQVWILDGSLIRSARFPGKCLHVKHSNAKNGGVDNGTVIHLWDMYEKCRNQTWLVKGRHIVSGSDPTEQWHSEGGTGNGTKIHTWNAPKNPNSFWKIEFFDQHIAVKPQFVALFSTSGGVKATSSIRIKVHKGYTKSNTVSSELHAKISQSVGAAVKMITAKVDLDLAATIRSNSTIQNTRLEEHEVTIHVDCSVPAYVYQMKFGVTVGPEHFEAYAGSYMISSKPMA